MTQKVGGFREKKYELNIDEKVEYATFTSDGLELEGYTLHKSEKIKIVGYNTSILITIELGMIMDDIKNYTELIAVHKNTITDRNTLKVTFRVPGHNASLWTDYVFYFWKKYNLIKDKDTIINEIIFAEKPMVRGYQLDSTEKTLATREDFVRLSSSEESVVNEIYEGIQWIVQPVRAFIDENKDLKVYILIRKKSKQIYLYNLSFHPLATLSSSVEFAIQASDFCERQKSGAGMLRWIDDELDLLQNEL